MQARRLASALRAERRAAEERQRKEQEERERATRAQEEADEQSIQEALKWVRGLVVSYLLFF